MKALTKVRQKYFDQFAQTDLAFLSGHDAAVPLHRAESVGDYRRSAYTP